MHIKKIHLKNFKRFTDLTIQDIPSDANLVLLIGSNGSGKSSVFEAFEFSSTVNGKDIKQNNLGIRYNKDSQTGEFNVTIETAEYGLIGQDRQKWRTRGDLNFSNFYGRTSFRQVPRLTRKSLGGSFNIRLDDDRPSAFIDYDLRFENDLEHLFGKLLKEFFRTTEDKSEIKEKVINPINEALDRIFNKDNGTKLSLLEIIPPLEGKIAEVNFKKGNSIFHYNYLSAGEKEVFNILINLIARQEFYQDTIYFFDEIDLHLNTSLQFNFLKEIVENWMPRNCQLWTASHSLGFIEYAKQSGQGVIIDFDDLDFDLPRVLIPEPKDNPDVYEIAVGKEFLSSLFQQMTIYFVENTDKDLYAMLGLEKTVFVSENNRNSVYHKVRTTNYRGIVDRGFLSDDDIAEIRDKYPRLYILSYYSLENYLYHPDNLSDYYSMRNLPFDKDQYIRDLTEAKNQVKDNIIPSLSMKRMEYPYFGEPGFNDSALQKRFKNKGENIEQSSIVASYLNSSDFETYYKSLPMKSYCTSLLQRQHIAKTDLAKTNWFKVQIASLLA